MYTFFSDPGHGWLQVPKQEVINSGIYVSRFSYQDDAFVYLEEDCDCGRFLNAIGFTGNITEHVRDAEWIRNLPDFSQNGARHV